jgi:hypothetical protein
MLLVFVGLAGAAVAVLPSLGSAQATTASFVAVDSQAFFGQHFFYLAGTTDSTANIAVGGTVSFSYPTGGTSSHNVVFTGPQPTSCTQTATAPGYRIGPAPPLPAVAEAPGWAGTCTFDTAGTYPFDSAADGPAMSGTVVVGATTTTTGPTTSTGQTTAPGGGGTSTHNPVTHLPAAAGSLVATASQHGSQIRGQIHVTTPRSKVVADLDYGHPVLRIGRTSLKGVGSGTKHFTIGLYLKGKRLLAAHHRLTLTLKVEVVGQGVGPTVLTKHVTLTA